MHLMQALKDLLRSLTAKELQFLMEKLKDPNIDPEKKTLGFITKFLGGRSII